MTNCAKMKEKTRTTLVWSIKMFLLVVKKGRGGSIRKWESARRSAKKPKFNFQKRNKKIMFLNSSWGGCIYDVAK
jgi:hypothetical protein